MKPTKLSIAASVLIPATILAGLGSSPAFASSSDDDRDDHGGSESSTATPVFTFQGRYANGGSEVATVSGKRMYVIGDGATLDIVNISNPAAPAFLSTVDLSAYGASITSVTSKSGWVAVSLPQADKTDNGTVVVLNATGTVLASATVGALPDMLTFDEEGKRLVVANEGEPNSYAPKDDPEGSVSIIDVRRLVQGKPNAVKTVGFGSLVSVPAGVRIYGPGATIAEDLEPEYITINDDTAWVTLQEANAIARIDLEKGRLISVTPLAAKDHNLPGNGLDPSDRDNGSNGPAIKIANWPVFGLPMPDGIASFEVKDRTYLITANEGDSRQDWPGYQEEVRVGSSSYVLDPTLFPNASTLKNNANLGRLTVSKASGDTDGDGDYDRIEVFGTRSVSIWDRNGALVWDSGDQIEQATAAASPLNFNASNTNSSLDDRSDNKGPEPEGVAVGRIGSRTYAFVALERIGGFVVFDVTNPASPTLVQYANSRDFAADPTTSATDSGPEVIRFVSAKESPNGKPLVVVANEISHTVSIWSTN